MKLKELRAAAGLTQTQLAAQSGASLGAIRDYEQGKREPLLFTGFKLARALGVPVDAFADCLPDLQPPPRRTAGQKRTQIQPKKSPIDPPGSRRKETVR
ncbi:MAG: helix-turn-helix transcriptional regulator [Planctomycetia bacterium]|nr:helix-turn-helix transcriptional regulator [Planctomycetia bacterium]